MKKGMMIPPTSSCALALVICLGRQPVNIVGAATDALDVNFLTASFDCSHKGKEWRICTQPEGWGSLFYCPAYSEYNETQLQDVEWGNFDVPTPLTPCFTCPGGGSNCSAVVAEVLTTNGIAVDQNSTLGEQSVWEQATRYCEDLCESNKEGDDCNQDSQCTPGELFCDYSADDEGYTKGTCRPCPVNGDECYEEGFAWSVKGQKNCRDCRLFCYGAAVSKLWIDGEAVSSNHPIDTAIQSMRQSASGPLHDCSDLNLDPANTCPGAHEKICLLHIEEQFGSDWQVSNQAEASGCVGIIAFIEGYDHPFSHANDELVIPFIYIPVEEGKQLLNNKIGAIAQIEVEVFGAGCYPAWDTNICKATWPCDKGDFCQYNSVPTGKDDDFREGECKPCPEDDNGHPNPIACFFDSRRDGVSDTVQTFANPTIQRVQSCAASCGAKLTSKGCKFCTSEVTGFEFGVDKTEDQCILCPEYDVQYRDRIVPLFGDNVTCWQLESFFKQLPVPKGSRNCQLAQSMNYICGCEGTGYLGADTQTKQAVLAWLPRVAAILSMMGSTFIIYDTQQTPLKRSRHVNKILCTISIFDFLGSAAYAFTTLPTPKTDYIYGSKGNEATCIAQGFFIQMGTIACLLGVSLALYYNLTIKHGWSEEKMKRTHLIYFLLSPPLVVGFTIAFIGIPYYDNVMMWCNNSARWWPEVPVFLAIFYATLLMTDLVCSVYKTEKVSSSYAGGGSNRLSKKVFKQALWFVGAFYITWVPYLVLQYMWSAGYGYDIYGLTLTAATLVPLQGFWNFFVYIRPRYLKQGSTLASWLMSVTFLKTQSRKRTESADGKSHATNGTQSKPSPVISVSNFPVPGQSDTVDALLVSSSGLQNEQKVILFGAPDPTKDSKYDEGENAVTLIKGVLVAEGTEDD